MSADPKSTQFRRTGRVIIACGIALAAFVYWRAAAQAGPVFDDTNSPGYTRAMNREVARLMGHGGLVMMDVNGLLTSPAGKALGVLALTALFAGYFFRVAWVMDEEARERLDEQRRVNG